MPPPRPPPPPCSAIPPLFASWRSSLVLARWLSTSDTARTRASGADSATLRSFPDHFSRRPAGGHGCPANHIGIHAHLRRIAPVDVTRLSVTGRRDRRRV